MARVYAGLGSNIEPEHNLKLGVDELRQVFGALDLSAVYRSKSLGFEGADFLNMVAGFDTDIAPADIHEHIERIHDCAGRSRGSERYSSRPLDIDLLLYDDLVADLKRFKLPRSDVLKYSFVLKPLAELDPERLHPTTGQSLRSHWQAFDQASHPLERVDGVLDVCID